jgi:hypothetical protein
MPGYWVHLELVHRLRMGIEPMPGWWRSICRFLRDIDVDRYFQKERFMSRFMMCLTLLIAMAGFDLCSTVPARADAWGCSYEKCVAYCMKVGGQRCSAYCTNKLREKQLSKACPVS